MAMFRPDVPNPTGQQSVTSYWDLREANVVCKEFGFPYAYGTQPSGNLASDIGQVIVNKALCRGDEQQLGDCRFKQSNEECFDMVKDGAGVQCAESKYNDEN